MLMLHFLCVPAIFLNLVVLKIIGMKTTNEIKSEKTTVKSVSFWFGCLVSTDVGNGKKLWWFYK